MCVNVVTMVVSNYHLTLYTRALPYIIVGFGGISIFTLLNDTLSAPKFIVDLDFGVIIFSVSDDD